MIVTGISHILLDIAQSVTMNSFETYSPVVGKQKYVERLLCEQRANYLKYFGLIRLGSVTFRNVESLRP